MKWSEVKGIWSEEEIEYFQEKGENCDTWSEVKGILSEEEIEYFQEKGEKCDKWSEGDLKWEGNRVFPGKGGEMW